MCKSLRHPELFFLFKERMWRLRDHILASLHAEAAFLRDLSHALLLPADPGSALCSARTHLFDGGFLSEATCLPAEGRRGAARSQTPLTVGVVLAFGAVDFALPVDAKEELLVGEEFSPAHVSLEVVVAAPRVAPHHRGRRRIGRPGQPGGGGVRRRSM